MSLPRLGAPPRTLTSSTYRDAVRDPLWNLTTILAEIAQRVEQDAPHDQSPLSAMERPGLEDQGGI